MHACSTLGGARGWGLKVGGEEMRLGTDTPPACAYWRAKHRTTHRGCSEEMHVHACSAGCWTGTTPLPSMWGEQPSPPLCSNRGNRPPPPRPTPLRRAPRSSSCSACPSAARRPRRACRPPAAGATGGKHMLSYKRAGGRGGKRRDRCTSAVTQYMTNRPGGAMCPTCSKGMPRGTIVAR